MLSLGLFGTICLAALVWLVMDVMKTFDKGDAGRLEERLKGKQTIKTRDEVQAEKTSMLTKQQTATLLEMLVGNLRFVENMQRKLDQADMDMRASTLIGVASIISLVTLLGTLLAGLNAIVCFLIAPLPLVALSYFVTYKVSARRNRFVEQMPDAFELMVQSLRAGHALAGAINVIGEQMPDPIGKEFSRVYAEQNLGVRLEDAMLNLANRVDAMDVKFFVSAVLIQRQTGGDLAEVLEKISSLIRDRIELFGTVQALTAEGRLSGWVLLALPPGCLGFIMISNPKYAAPLFDEVIGRFMLMTAGVMMLLGMALIKKIVTIEV